jgi:hypothetical protein
MYDTRKAVFEKYSNLSVLETAASYQDVSRWFKEIAIAYDLIKAGIKEQQSRIARSRTATQTHIQRHTALSVETEGDKSEMKRTTDHIQDDEDLIENEFRSALHTMKPMKGVEFLPRMFKEVLPTRESLPRSETALPQELIQSMKANLPAAVTSKDWTIKGASQVIVDTGAQLKKLEMGARSNESQKLHLPREHLNRLVDRARSESQIQLHSSPLTPPIRPSPIRLAAQPSRAQIPSPQRPAPSSAHPKTDAEPIVPLSEGAEADLRLDTAMVELGRAEDSLRDAQRILFQNYVFRNQADPEFIKIQACWESPYHINRSNIGFCAEYLLSLVST